MRSPNDQDLASRRWERLREKKLAVNPFCECEQCQLTGEYRLATEVDHIIPRSQGGAVFDWDNLQSLCKSHHSKKTWAEMNGRKQKIDAVDPRTGLPLDPEHPWNREEMKDHLARPRLKEMLDAEKTVHPGFFDEK